MKSHSCLCVLDVLELSGYLLKSLKNLLPLTEVPKEQMQGSGHQRRIVVHGQVKQDPQESATTVIIQVQRGVFFTRHMQNTHSNKKSNFL